MRICCNILAAKPVTEESLASLVIAAASADAGNSAIAARWTARCSREGLRDIWVGGTFATMLIPSDEPSSLTSVSVAYERCSKISKQAGW